MTETEPKRTQFKALDGFETARYLHDRHRALQNGGPDALVTAHATPGGRMGANTPTERRGYNGGRLREPLLHWAKRRANTPRRGVATPDEIRIVADGAGR